MWASLLVLLSLAGEPVAVADDIRKDSRATVVLVAQVFGVRISDQVATSWWLSTHDLGAPKWGVPATSLPLPGLQVSRAADSSLVSGATLGGLASIDDVELRYAGQRLRDGTWTTDQFEGYEFEGRDATIYWLGQTADGRVVDWANKKTWFDGVVAEGGGWAPHQLAIPVRARGTNLDAELAGTYRGTPYALAYDGVDDEVSLGNILNPTGSFSWQTTFYAEAPPASGAVTQRLFDKGKWYLEYDATTAASPVLRWHVEVGGTTLAPTIAIPTYHRFYTATVSYNSSTGVARVRHDGTTSIGTATKSGGGNPDTDASTLYFGRQSSAAAKHYDGVIGQTARWDAALTESEELEYAVSVLAGDETNLVALWTGVRNLAGTKLVDTGPSYDPTTATSPYDGTITGAIEATTFDGGTDLAGTSKRLLVGSLNNVKAVPVYPSLKIFQISAESTHVPESVRDAGTTVTMDAIKNRIYDFFNTAVTATEYNFFPYYGAVRLADKQNFGDVTATLTGWAVQSAVFDSNGRNVHKPSRGLYLTSGYVNFGSSYSSLFYNSFTVTVRMSLNVPVMTGTYILSQNFILDGGSEGLWDLFVYPGIIGLEMVLPGGVIGKTKKVDVAGLQSISLVVSESGSTTTATVYVDGVELMSGSTNSALWSVDTADFVLGSKNPVLAAAPTGTFQEVRVYNSAFSAAQIRADLYADTPTSTPVHWYKPPLVRDPGSTWADSGSGTAANGTITNGLWAGGVPLATTRELTRAGLLSSGVDASAIDLSESWGISYDDVGLVVEGSHADASADGFSTRSGGTIRGVISDILSSLACAMVYDRSVLIPGRWVLRQIIDPDSVSSSLTITEDQVDSIGVPKTTRPPHRISLAYAPVDLVQGDSDLVSTADAALRQLVSAEFRYLERAIPGNVLIFPLQKNPLRLPGRLRYRSAARTEIVRRVTLAGVRRRVWPFQLVGGPWEHVTPGQVVTVVHRRIPGGSAKFLVLQITDSGAREGGSGSSATLYGWR